MMCDPNGNTSVTVGVIHITAAILSGLFPEPRLCYETTSRDVFGVT